MIKMSRAIAQKQMLFRNILTAEILIDQNGGSASSVLQRSKNYKHELNHEMNHANSINGDNSGV